MGGKGVIGIIAPRLVATAVALALAIWAASGFVARQQSAMVRSLAEAIEEGSQPRLDVLDQLHDDRASAGILARCNIEDLRALASVNMKETDLAYEIADPPRADRAGDAADRAIRKALSCGPLDGNLWLRLVMLQTARSGVLPTAFEYLRLSYWTAPSEGWIVRARVDFASRLLGAGVKDVEPDLRSDIRTLVNFDTNNNIAAMFLAAPEPARAIYGEWIELLPAERKQSLSRTLERRGVNLTGR